MNDEWQVTSLEEAQLVLTHVVGHPRLRDALATAGSPDAPGAGTDAGTVLEQHGILLPSNATVEVSGAATDSPHLDICVTVLDSSGHGHVWCVTLQPPIVFDSSPV